MHDNKYILLRKQMSQFCQLNEQTWNEICKIFVPRELSKNELFASEGGKPMEFGFLTSGCMRLFNLAASGKELTKNFFLPGDFFVAATNYYDQNLSNIQSLTQSELLIANYKELENLAEKNKHIAEFKANLVAKFILIKEKRENNYLTLEAIDRYKIFLQEYPGLLNQIPHHYIASYLGISPTQLSRIRNKLLCM